MSTTLNSVLEKLRASGNGKLEGLEKLAGEHSSWLRAAIVDAAQQLAGLAPASKKQRLNADGDAQSTETSTEQQKASLRHRMYNVCSRLAMCWLSLPATAH